MNWLDRTELLLGNEKLARLKNSNVLVVGLGGVGAYAAEQICRSGVGKMTLVDGDVVETTNRNRQLPALVSTTGQPKTEVLAARFRDINPEIVLTLVNDFISDEKTLNLLQSQPFDFVVDCIDTVSPKVFLIYHALRLGFPVVSSMGAGGKMKPETIRIDDISKTNYCKLAKVVRKKLADLGIRKGVQVVYSTETINEHAVRTEDGRYKKSVVGTISYMPPLFGCFISSVVIRQLTTSK